MGLEMDKIYKILTEFTVAIRSNRDKGETLGITVNLTIYVWCLRLI